MDAGQIGLLPELLIVKLHVGGGFEDRPRSPPRPRLVGRCQIVRNGHDDKFRLFIFRVLIFYAAVIHDPLPQKQERASNMPRVPCPTFLCRFYADGGIFFPSASR